jgi:hypothetical protein
MTSTKNKKKTPQLTSRAALTTPPGVFVRRKISQLKLRLCGQFHEGW